MVRHFHYDKLNRITKQETASFDVQENNWENKNSNYLSNYSYDSNGNFLNLQRNDSIANLMDNLDYTYEISNKDYYNGQKINRLTEVEDNVGSTASPVDFEGTSDYSYDNTGNLISDSGEDIDEIEWNTYGKVRKVTREADNTKPDLEFWSVSYTHLTLPTKRIV